MASDTKLNALLVGCGALGSVYAWRLQTSNKVDVTVVCRSNYDIVKTNGFSIKSDAFGNHTYMPAKVVRTIDEAAQDDCTQYDYVIISTKVLPNHNTPLLVSRVLSAHTMLVLIQNGIGIEDAFASQYPQTPICSGISYIDVAQTHPGTIVHGKNTSLILGAFTGNAQLAIQALADSWRSSGVDCTVVDDVQRHRWAKLVWNASFNTVAVASGGNSTHKMLANPWCRSLIREIMSEVYCVGKAVTGSELPPVNGWTCADEVIAATEESYSLGMPSMLVDFLARRPMEHDVILRAPIEAANERGVSVPYMKAVYTILVMLEKGYLDK